MNRKQKDYNFYIGAALTGMIVFLVLLGIVYTPYDPETMNTADKFAGISLRHLMGCDNFGRDIFSRILKGTGTTLLIALCTVGLGAGIGTVLGAVTGYYGGAADEILMRFNDAALAFPSILVALVFISIMGSGKYNVIIALGIVFIPSFARIVRGEFIHYRNLDYVQSAKLMGAGAVRIMFVHILPNAWPVLLSSVIIGFNNAVLAEAGMSFLGIGVQPPDASLGRMLSESQAFMFSAPWCALFPGLMIVLMILGFALLSEGLKRRS